MKTQVKKDKQEKQDNFRISRARSNSIPNMYDMRRHLKEEF